MTFRAYEYKKVVVHRLGKQLVAYRRCKKQTSKPLKEIDSQIGKESLSRSKKTRRS